MSSENAGDLSANEAPPPMPGKAVKSSILDSDEDDDDLFKSAVGGQASKLREDERTDEESGYDSVLAKNNQDQEVPRSDTMDDLVTHPINLDDDDEKKGGGDLFSPIDIGSGVGGPSSLADDATNGKENSLEFEEDDKPFQDAHLKPQLQLSGSSGVDTHTMPFQSGPEPAKGGSTSLQSLPEDEETDEFIDIKVISPHKVGEGMSSYMVYNVKTRTNINYFKKKEMSVNRRFSDFLGLHDKLSEKYLQNGRIIPPAPDKSVVGMTKVKMSKGVVTQDANGGSESAGQPEEAVQDEVFPNLIVDPKCPVSHPEFVERRRAALERYLNRTSTYSSLRTDPDFREFLEVEAELPRAHQTATISGRTVMRLITKAADSLTSITTKLEETDDWFEDKNGLIEQLELQMGKLHRSTESLVDFRRTLAANTLALSKSLGLLSGYEENTGLSAAIAQMSTVQEKVAYIHNDQASAEFFQLSELIKDYVGLIGAVKDVMAERVKAWQAWQGANSTLTKKREAMARAELQMKSDRVAQLRQEIADMERQQEMAQENFERISRLIKKEVEAFQEKKVKDFKRCIIKYLEAQLVAQDSIATEWERYLPEIQQVSI